MYKIVSDVKEEACIPSTPPFPQTMQDTHRSPRQYEETGVLMAGSKSQKRGLGSIDSYTMTQSLGRARARLKPPLCIHECGHEAIITTSKILFLPPSAWPQQSTDDETKKKKIFPITILEVSTPRGATPANGRMKSTIK